MLPRMDRLAGLGLAAMLGAFAASAGAAPAGAAEFVTGPVKVLAAAGERELRKGDSIEVGDLVSTGSGRAQLRFGDGGFVSLQPRTQFRIDAYHFKGSADGSARGVFRLLAGALRATSGLIGSSNRDAYQLKTPVATIAIGGAGYTGEFDGKSLKAAVFDGDIVLRNPGGELELGNGQAAFVRDSGTRPELSFERPRAGPATLAERFVAALRPVGDGAGVGPGVGPVDTIVPFILNERLVAVAVQGFGVTVSAVSQYGFAGSTVSMSGVVADFDSRRLDFSDRAGSGGHTVAGNTSGYGFFSGRASTGPTGFARK